MITNWDDMPTWRQDQERALMQEVMNELVAEGMVTKVQRPDGEIGYRVTAKGFEHFFEMFGKGERGE
jgi:hypothetical protein